MVLRITLFLLLHVHFVLLCQILFILTSLHLKKAERHNQVLQVVLERLILKNVIVDVGMPLTEQRLELLHVRVVKVHLDA